MPGILNRILNLLFLLLFSYQWYYLLISFIKKEKMQEYDFSYHDFAILICARNEESVIGDLLDSIDRQTYPKKHYKVFVMADNCEDSTAKIAERKDAIVYVRKNKTQIGKGYALQELLAKIGYDYGEVFDGFLVFDADNILKEDYLEQINLSYCQGNQIIASHLSSKNFSSSWISAGSSLFLYYKNRFLNYPRYLSGLGCAINGTGFFFSRDILKSWPYHTLTEDIEFTADQTCRHHKIAYCDKAIVYDEQPVCFRQSFDQRSRWAKGYLQVISRYSLKLLKGIQEGSFSCFDILSTLLSAYSFSLLSLLLYLMVFLSLLISKADFRPFLQTMFTGLIRAYLYAFLLALATVIKEWNQIEADTASKIRSIFTYPFFLATYLPIAVYALFGKVTWKPITHTVRMQHEKSL